MEFSLLVGEPNLFSIFFFCTGVFTAQGVKNISFKFIGNNNDNIFAGLAGTNRSLLLLISVNLQPLVILPSIWPLAVRSEEYAADGAKTVIVVIMFRKEYWMVNQVVDLKKDMFKPNIFSH